MVIRSSPPFTHISQTHFQHQTSTLFIMTPVPITPPPHTTPWPHVSLHLVLRGHVASPQVRPLTPPALAPLLESPSHQEEKGKKVGGTFIGNGSKDYVSCYSLSLSVCQPSSKLLLCGARTDMSRKVHWSCC